MQAMVSKEIKLKDSGQARRTYCYITDVLEMLIGILVKGQHQVYNVGGTSRTTIVDLAKAISNLTGSQLVVPQAIDVSDSGAPQEVWMDLDRIRSLLAKESFVGLEDGLHRTISWYRQFKSQINKDGDLVRK
jgi:nucleoside-diphosphate-sugar epimerase